MTPEEHQLINGLFERMRDMGPIEKDREAESFIMQSALATPDAAYKLVQSVLVQENALQQAGARIEELEARIQQLESSYARAPQAQQSSGGLFGGLFGGGRAAPQPAARQAGSVPAMGSRPTGGGTPWGHQAAQQGGYQQQPMGQMQQPARGGGFMKSAMATAAGVAGGMLVAGAIGNMLSGSSAQAATGSGTSGDQASSPHEVAQGTDQTQYQDPNANDPGTYEEDTASADEGGGGWFGGGGGSDDSEF